MLISGCSKGVVGMRSKEEISCMCLLLSNFITLAKKTNKNFFLLKLEKFSFYRKYDKKKVEMECTLGSAH